MNINCDKFKVSSENDSQNWQVRLSIISVITFIL